MPSVSPHAQWCVVAASWVFRSENLAKFQPDCGTKIGIVALSRKSMCDRVQASYAIVSWRSHSLGLIAWRAHKVYSWWTLGKKGCARRPPILVIYMEYIAYCLCCLLGNFLSLNSHYFWQNIEEKFIMSYWLHIHATKNVLQFLLISRNMQRIWIRNIVYTILWE